MVPLDTLEALLKQVLSVRQELADAPSVKL